MIEIKIIISTLLITVLTTISYSQGSSEYIAVDDYQRKIAKSEKISTVPELNDSVIEISDVKYYIEPTNYDITFETKPIKPAKIKIKQPLSKLYNGYVKIGLGTYTRPFLDAYYSSNRSKKKSWGVNAKHYSSLTNLKGVGTNLFSDNKFGGYYKHFFKKITLHNKLYYERNKYHYYGFNISDTLIPENYRNSKDSTMQVYQNVNYSASIRSINKDSSKISYIANLDYYYLYGKTKLSENNVGINSNIYKYIGREEVGADISLYINNLKQPTLNIINPSSTQTETNSYTKYANTVFKLNPFIKTRRGDFLAKVGAGVHMEVTSQTRFFFYPNLSASYSLFNDIFVPYAGIDGNLIHNNFNSFRKENPYVLENISTIYLNKNVGFRNTNQRINFYGGIKGSISSRLSFNFKAQYQKLGNLAMFVNDTLYSYENKFNIKYDSIDKTTLSAQLGYYLDEKIKIFLEGNYYNYSTLVEEYAWSMPNYELSIMGIYDLADKIIARLNVKLVGNRKTYSLNTIEGLTPESNGKYIIELKPYIDANLGVEYRYNKRLSAFLDVNNIVGKKYQQWLEYPVYTINVLGGVTYSF